MSEYAVFPKAPITEALFDIRAELPQEISLSTLAEFYNPIKDRYPEKQERLSFEAGFQMSPEGPTVLPTSKKPDGYLFRSSAENKIVQARLDGFTFNKLKPYEEWKLFRSEARELWEKYCEIAKPVKITRIALRYINRIEIPLPFKDIKEFILTTPEIAPKLPQVLEHFFMQIVIPMPDIPAKAIITQTIQNPTADVLPLIFDIDVYQEAVYSENQAEIWNVFEKLRNVKNEVFFNSITNKAKELFQ